MRLASHVQHRDSIRRDYRTRFRHSVLKGGLAESCSFVILHGLPGDTYKVVGVGFIRDGQVERRIAEDAEMPEGRVVRLGTTECKLVKSVEDAPRAPKTAPQRP